MEDTKIIEKQPIKVLLLYRTFGPSVNLCALLQLNYLSKQGTISFKHTRILATKKADLEWAQLVIFVRGDGLLDEWMAKVCRDAGKKVLYILDDDLLNVPMYLGSGAYYAQKSVKEHIKKIMEYSDYFASPSEILLKKYSSLFCGSFRIIEPSAYKMEKKPINQTGVIRIGFAGSSDRGSDIDTILSDALKQIVNHYGNKISIEIFGTQTKISNEIPCKQYSYTESYQEYQQKMYEFNWDIGLAPMPDTEFHNCKHYNKLVEYSSFGIAGIYSNVKPYAGEVENNVTGLLCENNTESWVNAITQLIENKSLRESISNNCLEKAKTVYSIEYAGENFGNYLEHMKIEGIQNTKIGFLGWAKLRGLASWYREKFQKFGWKTPFIAVKKIYQIIIGEV